VVAYAQNPTQSRGYQLSIDNPTLPTGLVVLGAVPPVSVTVIGTSDNLGKFDKGSLHVTANFSNVKVGTNQVPIDVQNSDSNVNIVAPHSVPVTVDERASSIQTVSIERVRALPPGFHEQLNATTVTPASVNVEGPKSQIAGIQAVVQVDLEGVPITGINQTYKVSVLDANKKLLPAMTANPTQVTVKMVIQADAITVSKAVGFFLTGQPAACYHIVDVQIAPLNVQATGFQSTLSTIAVLATDPVDIGGAKADVVRTVTIRPPAGVDVNQKTAQVHVKIAPVSASPSPGASPCP
jgi:hypothetical protein